MKKVCSYTFKKNNRTIETRYLSKKDLRKMNIHVHDAICLVLDSQDESKAYSFYLRPDEALLIASMLTETVRLSTKAYNLGAQRKYGNLTKEARNADR